MRTSAHSIVLRGKATPGATIVVDLPDGSELTPTAVKSGNWSARVPLQDGDNSFSLAANSTRPNYVQSGQMTLDITRVKSSAEIAAEKAAAEARAAAAKQSFINGAQAISYAAMIKDTTPFQGKKIVLHGQIFQIQQQQGMGGVMLVSVTDDGYGLWTDNIWVDYDQDVPYNEKDMVTVYGTVTGTKTYQTQSGGSTYVPEVHARYIQQG